MRRARALAICGALRPGLWHSTPLACYRAILADSEIRPSGGGFAASIGAASLFDFENTSEEEALGKYWKWATHLWPSIDARLTVLIGLNRNLLPGRLILAKEGGELAIREQRNWYPRGGHATSGRSLLEVTSRVVV